MNLYIQIIIISVITISCNDSPNVIEVDDKSLPASIKGSYLVDNIYFPQDTLIIKKLNSKNSASKEKLLIEIKNDSIFLSRHNFNRWYGKWFCNFANAQYIFDKDQFRIHANIDHYSCSNKNVWRDIKYKIIDWNSTELTLIKINDTSNCNSSIDSRLNR
tara:strand:- start:99 stop:578 length:480 start_codon:yes stop_codon:yes gene_type:complete